MLGSFNFFRRKAPANQCHQWVHSRYLAVPHQVVQCLTEAAYIQINLFDTGSKRSPKNLAINARLKCELPILLIFRVTIDKPMQQRGYSSFTKGAVMRGPHHVVAPDKQENLRLNVLFAVRWALSVGLSLAPS